MSNGPELYEPLLSGEESPPEDEEQAQPGQIKTYNLGTINLEGFKERYSTHPESWQAQQLPQGSVIQTTTPFDTTHRTVDDPEYIFANQMICLWEMLAGLSALYEIMPEAQADEAIQAIMESFQTKKKQNDPDPTLTFNQGSPIADRIKLADKMIKKLKKTIKNAGYDSVTLTSRAFQQIRQYTHPSKMGNPDPASLEKYREQFGQADTPIIAHLKQFDERIQIPAPEDRERISLIQTTKLDEIINSFYNQLNPREQQHVKDRAQGRDIQAVQEFGPSIPRPAGAGGDWRPRKQFIRVKTTRIPDPDQVTYTQKQMEPVRILAQVVLQKIADTGQIIPTNQEQLNSLLENIIAQLQSLEDNDTITKNHFFRVNFEKDDQKIILSRIINYFNKKTELRIPANPDEFNDATNMHIRESCMAQFYHFWVHAFQASSSTDRRWPHTSNALTESREIYEWNENTQQYTCRFRRHTVDPTTQALERAAAPEGQTPYQAPAMRHATPVSEEMAQENNETVIGRFEQDEARRAVRAMADLQELQTGGASDPTRFFECLQEKPASQIDDSHDGHYNDHLRIVRTRIQVNLLSPKTIEVIGEALGRISSDNNFGMIMRMAQALEAKQIDPTTYSSAELEAEITVLHGQAVEGINIIRRMKLTPANLWHNPVETLLGGALYSETGIDPTGHYLIIHAIIQQLNLLQHNDSNASISEAFKNKLADIAAVLTNHAYRLDADNLPSSELERLKTLIDELKASCTDPQSKHEFEACRGLEAYYWRLYYAKNNTPPGFNRELLMQAFIMDMDYFIDPVANCKSACDRVGQLFMTRDALEMFYAVNQRYPDLYNQDGQNEFIDYCCDVLLSGDQEAARSLLATFGTGGIKNITEFHKAVLAELRRRCGFTGRPDAHALGRLSDAIPAQSYDSDSEDEEYYHPTGSSTERAADPVLAIMKVAEYGKGKTVSTPPRCLQKLEPVALGTGGLILGAASMAGMVPQAALNIPGLGISLTLSLLEFVFQIPMKCVPKTLSNFITHVAAILTNKVTDNLLAKAYRKHIGLQLEETPKISNLETAKAYVQAYLNNPNPITLTGCLAALAFCIGSGVGAIYLRAHYEPSDEHGIWNISNIGEGAGLSAVLLGLLVGAFSRRITEHLALGRRMHDAIVQYPGTDSLFGYDPKQNNSSCCPQVHALYLRMIHCQIEICGKKTPSLNMMTRASRDTVFYSSQGHSLFSILVMVLPIIAIWQSNQAGFNLFAKEETDDSPIFSQLVYASASLAVLFMISLRNSIPQTISKADAIAGAAGKFHHYESRELRGEKPESHAPSRDSVSPTSSPSSNGKKV